MPDLWKKQSWIIHQENVPAHSTLTVKQFLANKCISVLDPPPPPPYSPVLAPCDFYLFPKVKSALKGTHFQSVDKVK
jgi:transposase